MTKGRVVLKGLIAKRKLREICESQGISYKFCHSVSEGKKKPSWELMKGFRFLMPVEFWFDEANTEFIDKIRNAVKE